MKYTDRSPPALHTKVLTQHDAEAFLIFYGKLLEIQARFVDALVEGRRGEPVPKDVPLRDYWTNSEVDGLFRVACEATGLSDPAMIDILRQGQTGLHETLTGLQEPLNRACDLLGITQEGRNRLGLFDS